MKKAVFITLLLISIRVLALGQGHRVFLDQISVDDGLSQSEIRCILKDSRGYMWFGTGNGLNRYDGYQITHYKNDPFNEQSLPNDEILAIADAGNGKIWVGTSDGLGRLDPSTGRVVRFPALARNGRSFSALKVTALATDSFGTLWVGTSQGLRRIVFDQNGGHQVIDYALGIHADDEPNPVRVLLPDFRNNRLWIGTRNGLARVMITKPQPTTSATGQRAELLSTEKQWTLPHPIVLSIAQDAAGALWVGTPDGLVRFNTQTGQPLPVPVVSNRLGKTLVSALLIDQTQTLWVTAGQQGIFRFDVRNLQQITLLDSIGQDIFGKKGLKSSNVLRLYEGPGPAEDIVWIGTYDAGVHLYSRAKNSFRHWNLLSHFDQPSTAAAVFSIASDQAGNRWFGTYNGLLRINQKSQTQQRYLNDPNNPYSLANNFVNNLLFDHHGTLWVGTAVGLQRFDARQNRFLPVLMPDLSAEKPMFQSIYSLFEDKAGRLWVGGAWSLRCIDPVTGKILKTYQYDPKQKNSMRAYMVSALCEDAHGQLWVGTWEGLYKLDPATSRLTHYAHIPSDPTSLISKQILSILIDRKQQVWVCSSKGVSRLTKVGEKEAFVHYTEQNGLPNSMVYGILEDQQGRLWVSTNYGLACLSPETGKFRNYEANDGLLTNEFNMGAYHKTASGEFFFGGIGTAVSFDPTRIVENRHRAQIQVTSFRVFDKTLNIDSLIAHDGRITLQPADDFFTVGFTSLDFTHPQKNQYAYLLEGLQTNWMPNGNRRYVSFIDLAPGDYILNVRGSTGNGTWNEAGILRLPIRILPSFWRTWWFYSMAFTTIAMLAWTFYSYRVRKRVEHLLEIERVTLAENERVRRLAAQDLHDEFGNTITRISMLTELIRARLNGHANDIGPLLTKISDNSNRLYQGTKDFIWAINPEHDNVYEVAIRLKDFGDDIFDKTGVSFQASDVPESLRDIMLPMGASRHLIFLFKEAMSNTLKHAGATATRMWIEQKNHEVQMHWQDNGIGIDPNPSYMGNGLLNMQSRAKRVGGCVAIDSYLGQGTTITFTLPVTHNGG